MQSLGNSKWRCVDCPPGTYSDLHKCIDCDAGTYASGAQSSACSACVAGYYGTSSAAIACVACGAGTFQTLDGATACTACPRGSYMPTTGGTYGCILCERGTYQPQTNTIQGCFNCSLGAYSDSLGASACVSCQSGKTTLYERALGIQQCVPCGAGRYVNATTDCVACLAYDPADPNAWSFCPGDGVAHNRTLPAPPATFVALSGDAAHDNVLSECGQCVAGITFALRPCGSTYDTACAPCGVAALPDSYLLEPCTPEADAQLGSCNGDLTPGGPCNACPPGTFFLSSATCAACPANTSKAGYGNASCLPCAEGTWSVAGAERCAVLCPYGQFAPDAVTCISSLSDIPRRTYARTPGGTKSLAWIDPHTLLVAVFGVMIWRMDASGDAWLVAGGNGWTDGSGANAGLGNGLLRMALLPGTQRLVATNLSCVRLMDYDTDAGVLRVTTLANWPGLMAPMSAVGLDGGIALIADRDAHCVWALSTTTTATAKMWRGDGTSATGMPTVPPQARLSSGIEWRLSNPSCVAFSAKYGAFVLDARAIWAFDALHAGPTGTLSDLAYVCGGGSSALLGTVACANANFAASQIVELLALDEGALPMLILLGATGNVWAIGLQDVVATLMVRPILPSSLRQSGGLSWFGGRLWVGIGSEVVECGLGAIAALDPLPELQCLCDAGLYCVDGQCVDVPAGSVAPAWSYTAMPCPAGTVFAADGSQQCVACALASQYTTYTEGAWMCEHRCTEGLVFYDGSCQPGCDASLGQYLTVHGCATCPLGTKSDGARGCALCPEGQYGVAGGVCAACMGDATTLFKGATLCLPCGTGYHRDPTTQACVPCLDSDVCPRSDCHDFDGMDGACDTTHHTLAHPPRLSSLKATSAGTVYAGDARLPATSEWIADITDDETSVFVSEPMGTCVMRNGTVWVGDCAEAGLTDGARSSGTVRLGHIADLALVAMDGITPVLFISTTNPSECPSGSLAASLRVASLYDGTVSTFVGSDAVHMPALLWPQRCQSGAFIVATARGTDEIVFAAPDAGDIWWMHTSDPSIQAPLMTLPSANVSALALRGRLHHQGMLIASSGSAVWLYRLNPQGLATIVRLAVAGATRLACAGRHLWWSNATGIYVTGVANAAEGCLGGYVPIAGGGCTQVGVGMFTTTGDVVGQCKAGTFGTMAGGATATVACAACPPGQIAPEGSAMCIPCEGATPFAANGECVSLCPPGTYRQASCVACPSGSSSPAGSINASDCVACAANQYANASTGGLCAACPQGTTSLPGSIRCVTICPMGTCAPNGDVCVPLTQNWEIITTVHIEGGETMHAIAVGAGGNVFYSDGTGLFYFMDNCSSGSAALMSVECQQTGVDLLPDQTTCPSCPRGMTALAVTHGFSAGGARLVYAISYSTHSLYRFPILFVAGSSVLVDVEATRALLRGETGTHPAYAAFYNSVADASHDATDLDGWRIVGWGGQSGFVDGTLQQARFNMPSEVELTDDDQRLFVSDFLNQRIRVVDVQAKTVSTLMGNGVNAWNYGALLGDAEASRPLGLGLSPDGRRLYVTQNSIDSVGVVDLNAGTFEPFCALNYDNAARYSTESCSADAGSRTCYLFRPWDVLASASGRVYVAATNALTIIDTSTMACQQVAGSWWTFYDNMGLRDGGVSQSTGVPSSLFNRPFKLSLDTERGVLYMADYSNGALRRAFVDGECRCANGAVFMPSAQACYNPTPAWDAGLLVACPSGQFALEGDKVCRSCDDASAYGLSASACMLWKATAGASTASTTGFTYARILATPEPPGAMRSDWFGRTHAASTMSQWNDIFRIDSTVTYTLGTVTGRVPTGGEFVSLTWDIAAQIWRTETSPLLRPVRLVPGFWYPCGSVDPSGSCSCSALVAAFADPNSGGGLVRWHELRLAASQRGGRVLQGANDGVRLSDFADGGVFDDASALVRAWSRFMARGTEEACPGDATQGPCFAPLVHHQQMEPPTMASMASVPPVELKASRVFPPDASVRCVVGWVAHYACPDGYTWVGPNTTRLLPDQIDAWGGQIACLSCLPGAYAQAAHKELFGGPYRCTRCLPGTFASGVGSTGCELCSAGKYASQMGAAHCDACPPNHYTYEGAMHVADCSPCPPGTGACVDCVPGQFQDQAAQYQCRACPSGTFSDVANATACTPCAAGTYQPRPGEDACYECPGAQLRYTPTATACVDCAVSELACPVVRDGVCGKGCGLNYYWNSSTDGSGRCERCQVFSSLL